MKKRPTGVTIIGILSVIGGFFALFAALGSFLLAAVVMISTPEQLGAFREDVFGEFGNSSGDFLGSALLAIGILMLALGIASFIVAYGTFKGKGWAWGFNVILSIIGIIANIATTILLPSGDGVEYDVLFTAVSIGINLVILHYLYRPHVKAFFGKGILPQAPAGQP